MRKFLEEHVAKKEYKQESPVCSEAITLVYLLRAMWWIYHQNKMVRTR